MSLFELDYRYIRRVDDRMELSELMLDGELG